jgi:hypothetical protein
VKHGNRTAVGTFAQRIYIMHILTLLVLLLTEKCTALPSTSPPPPPISLLHKLSAVAIRGTCTSFEERDVYWFPHSACLLMSLASSVGLPVAIIVCPSTVLLPILLFRHIPFILLSPGLPSFLFPHKYSRTSYDLSIFMSVNTAHIFITSVHRVYIRKA